jgi:hypothetical protein
MKGIFICTACYLLKTPGSVVFIGIILDDSVLDDFSTNSRDAKNPL